MGLVGKMRRTVQKNMSDTIAEGFYESDLWTSCGNYAMNKLLSGSYRRGFPFHKTIIIGGESGSGKSLIAATGAKYAQQEHSAVVVWIDIEKASKREWLEALGVDTDPERFLYLEAATIGDVKKIIAGIVKDVKSEKEEEREKVYIVVDSYSMLMTEKSMEEAVKGDLVGDMGQQAKQLKDLVKSITHLIGRLPICVVGMVHSMASQDKYNPDEILTGGRGLQYAASMIVAFSKLKLKADQLEDNEIIDEWDDNKKIAGIRCKCNVYKSRFAKPNEKVEVQIPWPHGLDPYSGLFDQMLDRGIIKSPSQGWYQYEDKKFRKKDFRDYADYIMTKVDTENDHADTNKMDNDVHRPEDVASGSEA